MSPTNETASNNKRRGGEITHQRLATAGNPNADAPREKIVISHIGKPGRSANRVLYDASLNTHLFTPGTVAEIEVVEAEAERLRSASEMGDDLRVEGAEPPQAKRGREVQLKGIKDASDEEIEGIQPLLSEQPSRADIEKREQELRDNVQSSQRQAISTRRRSTAAPAEEEEQADEQGSERLTKKQMEDMTIADLQAHAESNQIDLTGARTHAEHVEAIQKHQRKASRKQD